MSIYTGICVILHAITAKLLPLLYITVKIYTSILQWWKSIRKQKTKSLRWYGRFSSEIAAYQARLSIYIKKEANDLSGLWRIMAEQHFESMFSFLTGYFRIRFLKLQLAVRRLEIWLHSNPVSLTWTPGVKLNPFGRFEQPCNNQWIRHVTAFSSTGVSNSF